MFLPAEACLQGRSHVVITCPAGYAWNITAKPTLYLRTKPFQQEERVQFVFNP